MNEYLKKFLKTFGTPFPDVHFDDRDITHLRKEWTNRYSFAIPDDEAIQKIVELSPIIEIGAGTGYWAKLISEAGGNIIAIDNGRSKEIWTKYWFEIQKGTHKEIINYSNRVLLLCWPTSSSETAFDTLKLYRGTTVIYIGEGQNGCVATDKFFEYLEEHFIEKETLAIPRWPGLHDDLGIYVRKQGVI